MMAGRETIAPGRGVGCVIADLQIRNRENAA